DLIRVFGVDELSDLYDAPVLDVEYPGRVGLVDSAVSQLGPSRRLSEHPLALCDECGRCEPKRSADVELTHDALVAFGGAWSIRGDSSLLLSSAPERRDCHQERKNSVRAD